MVSSSWQVDEALVVFKNKGLFNKRFQLILSPSQRAAAFPSFTGTETMSVSVSEFFLTLVSVSVLEFGYWLNTN